MDVDPRNGGVVPEGLPDTRVEKTPGGGWHFWFSVEHGKRLPAKLGDGLDVIHHGKYAVVAPSPGYEVVNDAPIAPWPETLASYIEPGSPRRVGAGGIDDNVMERFLMRCPAHKGGRERTPSLQVSKTAAGVVLLHCFAGCDTADVMAAAGWHWAVLFPDAPDIEIEDDEPDDGGPTMNGKGPDPNWEFSGDDERDRAREAQERDWVADQEDERREKKREWYARDFEDRWEGQRRAKERQAATAAEDADRPWPFDVTQWRSLTDDSGSERYVVTDLIAEGQVMAIIAEEGDGKTTLAEQLCREILGGDKILGFFEPGVLRPRSILLVDTEMTQAETWPRWAEAERRGLRVPDGALHWVNSGPLDLTTDPDRKWLEALLSDTGSDFCWIDAGTSAVPRPKEDEDVRALFAWLQQLIGRGDLLAAGLTLHPRKRGQGEYGRRFDDLFGSREWKGKASRVLYLDDTRIMAWKDRGHPLHRRWPARTKNGNFPVATLARPGLDDPTAVPFRIEVGDPEPDEQAHTLQLMERAIQLVKDKPDHYSASLLGGSLGVQKVEGIEIVRTLLHRGVLAPDKPRARLRVIEVTCVEDDENAETGVA